jgi:N-acetylneuraminic acid mutarotase
MRTLLPIVLAAFLSAPVDGVPPPLPEPVTNNVVAVVEVAGREHIVSLLGLGPGKTWRDLRSGGYLHVVGTNGWVALPEVPDGQGRLAATAATLAGGVFIFGGYTVAEDGSESSTPYVYRLDVVNRTYQRLADMPTPVDDSVALVHRDRYVYLVSGWHDVDNVALVQLYDVVENRWRQATPFPGTPVFGHAGAFADGHMLICDGVRVVREAGPGKYAPSDECWLGMIDEQAPERIDWTRVPAHPSPPRYRSAAIASDCGYRFVGGSTNPYNYDGIGYDGRPSEPESDLLCFDRQRNLWQTEVGPAVMDLRALAVTTGGIYVIGGMRTRQTVSASIATLKPAE